MSSIFENKNLIDELIKCGLDFERKFLKSGQDVPTQIDPQIRADYAAVQSIITSLQHRIRPPQNPEGADTTTQNTNTEQSGSVTNPALFEEVASLQPFNSQYINTQEILTFAQKFALLANKEQISNIAQQIEKDINIANKLMASPGLPIQMDNLTASQFKTSTNSPQPPQLARSLYTIVSTAGRLYQLFYTQYRQQLGDAARSVEQQIASGGPVQTNLADLLELIQALDRDWQQQRGAPVFRDQGRR